MYIVRNGNGDIVVMASRRDDAEACTKTFLDKTQYTIENR